MKKDISPKKWQKRGGANTHVRQNGVSDKVYKKREGCFIMIKISIQ